MNREANYNSDSRDRIEIHNERRGGKKEEGGDAVDIGNDKNRANETGETQTRGEGRVSLCH